MALISSSTEPDRIALELSHAATPFIGAGRALESFGEREVLADANGKFLIRDDGGNPELVALCSGAGGPEIVARSVQRARDMEARCAFANATAELGQRLERWPRNSYLSTIDRCYRKLIDGR